MKKKVEKGPLESSREENAQNTKGFRFLNFESMNPNFLRPAFIGQLKFLNSLNLVVEVWGLNQYN